MHSLFVDAIGILWAIFWFGWLVSAFWTKKSTLSPARSQGAAIRILILVVVIVAFRNPSLWTILHSYLPSTSPLIGGIGLALCIIGLGFAVWARVYLGRNWGVPMSLKQDPELVTTGPYHLVRHPIYSGILVAFLGSALVFGLTWIVILIFFLAYFVYSAKVEEKLMAERFPQEYPAYKSNTKMLIPYLL